MPAGAVPITVEGRPSTTDGAKKRREIFGVPPDACCVLRIVRGVTERPREALRIKGRPKSTGRSTLIKLPIGTQASLLLINPSLLVSSNTWQSLRPARPV